MLTIQSVSAPQELAAALAIRHKVFVEGQGVPADAENDEHDHTDARHYLARTTDGTPCGAARWRRTEGGVKLERFAVLEEYRNQAVGAALLRRVLADVAAAYPGQPVYLNAQLRAIPFYERHGFAKVGEQFTECDIEHFKMKLHKAE
ncbi:Predicted N-acyltransferase, GNAT family [Hymenobacter daecheongensis DSM 21074]|uniref:Predicted N-acyltransferase, GNAT family n=1 Tax=Hymenobacter daecheongensis DSM 21074 TaxID=1121955 RepID=A0A1M6G243_9BACT|nr:GNAT family N-acetyltransferase [Hymenobacter daecheongensis]SHJ04051.1 Predicted N-acyltransferase, GNAT family [Hymenobacter daecheongensis DSM 21074]